jgi:hypothetical protein
MAIIEVSLKFLAKYYLHFSKRLTEKAPSLLIYHFSKNLLYTDRTKTFGEVKIARTDPTPRKMVVLLSLDHLLFKWSNHVCLFESKHSHENIKKKKEFATTCSRR